MNKNVVIELTVILVIATGVLISGCTTAGVECPHCGSTNVELISSGTWPDGTEWEKFQCNDCGEEFLIKNYEKYET